MSTISEADLRDSISDALQYISYYHPPDFIQALSRAYQQERSPAARNALAQILENSRLCALGHRPICQDTGIVVVFADIGMDVHWSGSSSFEDMINQGVSQAYTHPDNPLRASVLLDPAGKRSNSGDNTPAVIHTRLVPGDKLSIHVAAKGGGSENKARFVNLNPSDSIADWVLDTVPKLGAGWCPPGILGIGVGGTPEKAMLLAKRSLMTAIDMPDLLQRKPENAVDELRLEIFQRVNKLGIGAQGLGGAITVLDVKILDYPTHAASKPVALIPNCAATRHIHFELNGDGPAKLAPPDLSLWPQIDTRPSADVRRVNLDTLDKAQIASWKPGETLLLSGRLLTGRDSAHKRLVDLIAKGQPLPVDFHNRFIYYVGPVDPIAGEAVGPAGPTTATRMDKFTESILANTGLIGMIGKAERGAEAIESIKRHQAVYLIATGGAAYLVSKAIKSAKKIAFEDLGMEAIHEFVVEDMPVTVAVDSKGTSVHESGPREFRIAFP